MERAAVSRLGTSGRPPVKEGGEGAGEEAYLVFEPDGADDRGGDADLVDEGGAGLGFGPADDEVDDAGEEDGDPPAVVLGGFAEGEEEEGEAGEFGAELVVEFGEAGDYEGDEEEEEKEDHDQQEGWVDEGGADLFAEGEGYALEGQVAGEDLFEVAGALAGEEGGGVDEGDVALGFEGFGEGLAGADAGGDVVELGAEGEVFLALGEEVDGAEDGEAGFDQRKELLIKDKEHVELDFFLAAAAKGGAGLDGIDEVAGLGEAGAEFLGRGGGVCLFEDAAAFVGEADEEFCHAEV